MKIERHTIRRRDNNTLVFDKKHVLTKIDDHHYLAQAYVRRSGTDYMNDACTSNFDGENTVNGVVRTTTVDTVDEKFELLVKYEGYKYVTEVE